MLRRDSNIVIIITIIADNDINYPEKSSKNRRRIVEKTKKKLITVAIFIIIVIQSLSPILEGENDLGILSHHSHPSHTYCIHGGGTPPQTPKNPRSPEAPPSLPVFTLSPPRYPWRAPGGRKEEKTEIGKVPRKVKVADCLSSAWIEACIFIG